MSFIMSSISLNLLLTNTVLLGESLLTLVSLDKLLLVGTGGGLRNGFVIRGERAGI